MLKRVFLTIVAVFALVGACALAAGAWFMNGGINSKQQPGQTETTIARKLRAAAIPDRAKKTGNPIRATSDVLEAGMAHFADHCASCHGNDGGADTEMARGLYPKVPDMRKPDTQGLSDGELFYIIENGVRLTGMPAWGTGTPEGAEASWALVHFIRHLPDLTDAELEKMKAMNPKSADEWRRRRSAGFSGGDSSPKKPAAGPHKHGG
jgi:mono/diheme cytochrome c family protein